MSGGSAGRAAVPLRNPLPVEMGQRLDQQGVTQGGDGTAAKGRQGGADRGVGQRLTCRNTVRWEVGLVRERIRVTYPPQGCKRAWT